MPRRVLLASMDVGGGHRALRDSFAALLSAADPSRAEWELIPFDSRNRSVDRFYSACVRHLPALQGLVWHLSERAWIATLASVGFRALISEVTAALRQSGCELAIATHPLLSIALAQARKELAAGVVLASAVPDYGQPTAFFHPAPPALRPDHLLVFSEQSHAHLLRQGVPRERLHWSGFVTHDAFVQEGLRRDRNEGRLERMRALSTELPDLARLDPTLRTALFLGGSGWASKTSPVLEQLLARPELAQTMNLVVVCGRDEAFASRLRARTGGRSGIAVFGYLQRPLLAALMAVSDVPVLGSLAPATLHELLEVGLGPLLVFRVIPGSEPPHVAFLERERLGIYEPDPERMVRLIERAVRSPTEQAWSGLAETFRTRALAVRTLSRARAQRFPDAVRAMLGAAPQGAPAVALASG